MNKVEWNPRCGRCEVISRCLFSGMLITDRDRFLETCRQEMFGKGVRISLNGSDDKGLHVLCSGRGTLTFVVSDGREVLLGFAGPGNILPGGMYGLRSASALYLKTGHGPVRTLSLSSVDVAQALKDRWLDPIEFQKAHLTIQERYVEALETLHYRKAEQRLGSALLRCVAFFTMNGRGNESIELPITHQQLADMCGLMRNTVTLILKRFRQRDLVRVGRGRIVCRPDRIRRELTG